MTPKQGELKQEIWEIWQILIIAKASFQYSYYLYNPDTAEEREYLLHSTDFNFFRQVLWRTAVVDLSKLFRFPKDQKSNSRERYNLKHFVSKLKKAGHFGDLRIDTESIRNWEHQFEENENLINKVLKLRDNLYAHTTANKAEFLAIDISFPEVENLILITESIIKNIHFTVFGSDVKLDTPYFDKDSFDIIKILAEERRKEIKEILGDRFKLFILCASCRWWFNIGAGKLLIPTAPNPAFYLSTI